jgi:nucleoid DNA-binding protein
MESLIENFLLRHNHCPLPKVGTLELKQKSAELQTGEHVIKAPFPFISLSKKEKSAASFIHFIAKKKGIDETRASQELIEYCQDIINLDHRKEIKLNHTGKFYIDHDGTLDFRQDEIPEEFLPSITVQKVIHPNSVHSVRVGDKEHTNDFMKNQLKNFVTIKRSTWWIWAVLLTTIATVAIVYHIKFNQAGGSFGNSKKVTPSTEVKTYRAIN